MCTVIYIPTEHGPIFSSCRDEDPGRAVAYPPGIKNGKSGLLVYPTDAAARGTWIGVHSKGHLLVLLNGAFKNHEKKPRYKKSRGLIMTELLDTNDPLESWKKPDLQNIEPFTIVLWQQGDLYELVWDGFEKFQKPIPVRQPALWSSATLYPEHVQEKRRNWLKETWKIKPLQTAREVLDFLQAHHDAEDGFVMSRSKKIQTLSISLVQLHPDQSTFEYHDLREKVVHQTWLKKNTTMIST